MLQKFSTKANEMCLIEIMSWIIVAVMIVWLMAHWWEVLLVLFVAFWVIGFIRHRRNSRKLAAVVDMPARRRR